MVTPLARVIFFAEPFVAHPDEAPATEAATPARADCFKNSRREG